MQAQDYIIKSLRRLGQMRPGYTPQPELMQDAFNEWLGMFDSWNAERTMNYHLPDYVYPVTGAGHATTGNGQTFGGGGYEIGPTAADFVGPRPTEIVRVNLYTTTVSPTMPIRIPLARISMEEWIRIAVPALTAINITTVFAWDPQWPNGVIWVWPPLNAHSLEIFTWGVLTPPTTLSDDYTAPPGYEDAITWTLAQRCWPLCTKDFMPHKLPLPYISGQASIARNRVKAINAPNPKVANDFQGGHDNKNVNDLGLILTGSPY